MKIIITKNEIIEKFNLPIGADLEIVNGITTLDTVLPTGEKYWSLTDRSDVSTSSIIAYARTLFSLYIYDEKNLDTQFPAPSEDIKFSVKKSIEPDGEHRNKSYNQFIKEDKTFINFRQYLLLCIFVWETEKKHLDIIGWTRTSSLWSDGHLVYGDWSEINSKLYMDNGSRGSRDADDGPRELELVT